MHDSCLLSGAHFFTASSYLLSGESMLVAHGSLNNIAEVPNRGFYCPLLDYSMTDEIIIRKTSTLIIEKESWSSFSHDRK